MQYHKFNYICDNQSEDKHFLKGATRHTHFAPINSVQKMNAEPNLTSNCTQPLVRKSMSFMLLRTTAVESKRKCVANELGSASISLNLKGAFQRTPNLHLHISTKMNADPCLMSNCTLPLVL